MTRNPARTATCKQLLDTYHAGRGTTTVNKMTFTGVGHRDVYNITAPFMYNGEEVLMGRVEERDSEFSQVFFFTCHDGVWRPRAHTHTYNLQDPCWTRIRGELIVGGVEVITAADDPHRIVSWVTQFYRGYHIDSLTHFSSGPGTMKDIRLIELDNGSVGVFTRPQGERGGRGQIGFTVIPSLDELNEQTFIDAEVLQDQFVPEEWGGANEAHLLRGGMVGVLGHIACFDSAGNKHYYAMAFSLNPETYKATPVKIIAVRSDFPAGPGKRKELEDVIFSGGLKRLGGGRAVLSVGVSDAEAYQIEIADPFDEYES
ncbi:DUF1861 family protein [Paenibacillus sp. FSL R5-0887]|jgi:hypothetical protein|uniref:DUF1861 family protein n=1 Tax=Paenibacillus TaxID=44249 RepID=UPI00096C8C38|nr:DUF1861 family protein [Paenibacillus odorifer]OMD56181.1 hypothetical protein BSK55_22885 [Paenibacillus odorifer]